MAEQFLGTGRRKTSTARVFLTRGKGTLQVNGKSIEEYFGGRKTAHMMVRQPLTLIEMLKDFDINITVKGGGTMGQAGAIRHGITRALLQYDETGNGNIVLTVEGPPENYTVTTTEEGEEIIVATPAEPKTATLRAVMRRAGFVSRDSRKVERKKVGLKKARKAEQYSKR